MRNSILVSFSVCLALLGSKISFAEEQYWSSTIEDVIELNTPKENQVHAVAIGGGGIFVSPDSDLDDTAGGSLITRYTYRETVSAAGNIEFFEVSVDKGGLEGDVFVTPSLFNALLHSPAVGPLRFYVMAGFGFQFNDADVTADPVVAGLGGKVIVAAENANIAAATSALNLANAEATAATTVVSAATTSDAIAQAQGIADAANSRALEASEALAAAQQTQVIDLSQVNLPAGLVVDLDIEDGFIYTVGAGVDVKVTKNIYWNTEIRYQMAEFDLSGSIVVPELGTVKIDDEIDFDIIVLRTGILIRI